MGSGHRKAWVVISSPCCCTASGRDAYAKYYSGDGGDLGLGVSGAAGSSRSEHYRRQVSRWHGLSSNAQPRRGTGFPCLLLPLRDTAAPSLLDAAEGVKGDASPRQGAGSARARGLFLSQVKHSSAWGDELWGRGRSPNRHSFLDAGPTLQLFNESYSPELQPGMTGVVLGAL